jgi:hypothetical protein
MSKTDNSLLDIVNASGFLFQLRVEHEIQASRDKHKWKIVAREHRWVDRESGAEGFIDLVLGASRYRMAVECKRVRDANWVFLAQEGSLDTVEKARLLWTYRGDSLQAMAAWDDLRAHPQSVESPFCMVRGQGEKDTSMLERLSGILLRSLEALAQQELQLPPQHSFVNHHVYIPLIVTTAELRVCRFSLEEIDLETGQLAEDKAEFQTVSFLRFRKGLATNLAPKEPPNNLEQANQQSERTIFIVQAKKLSSFLQQFELAPWDTFDNWPWDSYRRLMHV